MASLSQTSSVSATSGNPAGTGKTKGKKSKPTKITMDEFQENITFKAPISGWADMMEQEEDCHVAYMPNVNLPEAPKSMMGPEIDLNLVPTVPPFKLTVANLNFELNEADIIAFFKNLKVSHCRINEENGRFNGIAFLEFETRDDLISALEYNGRTFRNRAVRVYLPDHGYGGYGDRRGGGENRGRYNKEDSTPNNWRSSRADVPPKNVYPPPTTPGYGGGRDDSRGYNRAGSGRYGGSDDYSRPPRSDYGGRGDRGGYEDRGGDGDGYGRRGGGGGRDYGSSGRGNWSRGGAGQDEPESDNWRTAVRDVPPPVEAAPARDRYRDNNPRSFNRADSLEGPPPVRTNDQYRSGDSYRGRGDGDRRDRHGGDYRSGGDERRSNDYRAPSDEPYERRPQYERPPRERDYPAGPRERTISNTTSEDLYDMPRSVPSKSDDVHDEPRRRVPSETVPGNIKQNIIQILEDRDEPAPASYSSIFGNAKPIDTLKREMEIEEKLEKMRISAEVVPAAAKAEDTNGAAVDPARRRDGGERRRMNGGGPRDGPRRDYDDRNGGALGRDGPRRDNRRDGGMDNRGRRGPREGRDYNYDNRGMGGSRDGGRYDRRPGGGGGFPDDAVSSRYYSRSDRVGRDREGGYDNYDSYESRGGRFDYSNPDMIKSDEKVYTSKNKFAHLNDTEDHGLE